MAPEEQNHDAGYGRSTRSTGQDPHGAFNLLAAAALRGGLVIDRDELDTDVLVVRPHRPPSRPTAIG